MSLTHLSDEALVASIASVCADERRLLARLIQHLVEVEDRRLHLKAACSSMFDFCVRRLGMSEGGAFRRINAARLVRRFPGLLGAVERGELHLSSLVLLRDHLTEANVEELVAATRGRSKREVEELLARRAPRPDVPSTLRRLPAQGRRASSAAPPSTGADEARGATPTALPLGALAASPVGVLAASPVGSLAASPVGVLAAVPVGSLAAVPVGSLAAVPVGALAAVPVGALAPVPVGALTTSPVGSLATLPALTPSPLPVAPPARARIEPLADARYKLQLTASAALRDKLERARDLMRHRNPGGDLAVVVERALDALLVQLEKERRSRASAAGVRPPSATRAAARSPSAEPASADPASAEPASAKPASAKPASAELVSAEPASVRPRGAGGESASSSRRRQVPRAVRRAVFERDGEQCTFTDATGARCPSRTFLELDHVDSRALGGSDEASNLRVRCRAHNALHAEEVFGRAHVAAHVHFRQRKCRGDAPASAPAPRGT
jgi:hypothetical protein